MIIEFKFCKETRLFISYKSDNFEAIGDYSKLYVRQDCELSKHNELVLISKKEYEFLKAIGDNDGT